MNEFVWNSIVVVLQFLYTIFIVVLTNALVKRGILSQSTSRKIVHMWAGGMVLFWPLYSGRWAPIFFSVTPGIWVFLLLYTALTKGPEDPTVRSMTRTGNPRDLLKGVLFFPLMVVVLTLTFWRSPGLGPSAFPALAGIAACGFGDGAAPFFARLGGPRFGSSAAGKAREGAWGCS